MGGYGSGRWNLHKKAITVESCYALSTKSLRQWGLFDPAHLAEWSQTLTWSFGGQMLNQCHLQVKAVALEGAGPHLVVNMGKVSQLVNLAVRTFRFGGRSWWLVCPGCGGQCLKLFLPPGAWNRPAPFQCRSCWALTYTAAQEAHYWDRGNFAAVMAPLARERGCSLADLAKRMQRPPCGGGEGRVP